MIVVADTTPIRHLVAIGEVDLLRKLYGVVTLPSAVWRELQPNPRPTRPNSGWRAHPHGCGYSPGARGPANTRTYRPSMPARPRPFRLAIELEVDLLLMDDRNARAVALTLRLPVTGTLGVLEIADTLGLLPDFERTLSELVASGFYLSARLHHTARQRHRARHGMPD